MSRTQSSSEIIASLGANLELEALVLLGHTRLLVRRFSECYRFYRDILHLDPAWGDEAGHYASFRQAADCQIVLALFDRQAMAEVVGRGSWTPEAQTQDRAVLIFGVQDLDHEIARLRQEGVEISAEPADFPDWGMRGAYIRDPDGNLLELSGALPVENWTDGLRQEAEKWKNRGKNYPG